MNTGIQKYSFVAKVYHMDDEAGSNFYLNARQWNTVDFSYT